VQWIDRSVRVEDSADAWAAIVREARFREGKTLATFDWQFNARAIERAQVEELAAGDCLLPC
jgi:hypothetical protein